MYVCMHACMHACMYVCMYIHPAMKNIHLSPSLQFKLLLRLSSSRPRCLTGCIHIIMIRIFCLYYGFTSQLGKNGTQSKDMNNERKRQARKESREEEEGQKGKRM